MKPVASCLLLIAMLAQGASVRAETGYDLWLRYAAVDDRAQLAAYRRADG